LSLEKKLTVRKASSSAGDDDQEMLNSPVLSTDQLYKSAGWFDEVVPEGAYTPKRDILDIDSKSG